MSDKYVTIKVPKDLVDEIEDLIEKLNLGYRNRSEFIIETVRNRVLSLYEQLQVEAHDRGE